MALWPDLVRDARPHRAEADGADPRALSQSCRVESHGFWQSLDGYTDSHDRADAGRGKAYLAAAVRLVARSLLEFYRAAG